MRFDRDGTSLWPFPKQKAWCVAMGCDLGRWGKVHDSTIHRFSKLCFFFSLSVKIRDICMFQYWSHFLKMFFLSFSADFFAIIFSSKLLAAWKLLFFSLLYAFIHLLISSTLSPPPPTRIIIQTDKLTAASSITHSSRLCPTNLHRDNLIYQHQYIFLLIKNKPVICDQYHYRYS